MSIETQAKYHHLIPQTYMSPWGNESGTLKIEFINNPGVIKERNKEKIGGFTDYHTIKAGMPICTQNDTDMIFASVSPYIVSYDGRTIRDSYELNKIYWDFENWHITRPDGSPVSKKQIKNEIEKVKIKDIELNWSIKYENYWKSQIAIIEDKVLNTTDNSVTAFNKEYIMKFFIALDWRGFHSNAQFEKALFRLCNDLLPLSNVDIPEDDRVLNSLRTVEDEMRHFLLLQYYRQYLNDSGVIYNTAMLNLKNTSFHFLVADGPTLFVTSDSPAFVHTRPDGSIAGLIPISPKILLVQGKNTFQDKNYYITHIDEKSVKTYNEIIKRNAYNFIIHTW